ncbi:hypothetical protein NMY22_g8478 [Coprinellus aureogranulatus]|nr:hypothetical protein NMY22_g8478 [Coprinellus aureogranulatus]
MMVDQQGLFFMKATNAVSYLLSWLFALVSTLLLIVVALFGFGFALGLLINGLNLCGVYFSNRFHEHGLLLDISVSIFVLRTAVVLTPAAFAKRPLFLTNLGMALSARFCRLGNTSDITSSIALHREAVRHTAETHVAYPDRLTNLASSLSLRFAQFDEGSDMDEAIETYRRAVRLMELRDHHNLPDVLHQLGSALTERFHASGKLPDISVAIEYHRRAVDLTREGDPALPSRLSLLGVSLWSRCGFTGELADIVEAIRVQRRGIELVPTGDARLPGMMSYLAKSLASRFNHTGDPCDVNEAISLGAEAVSHYREGHPALPAWLSSLADAHRRRFERTGNISDIDEAIAAQERAIQLIPNGHTLLPKCVNNLASYLMSRFERTGHLEDISKAISASEEAIKLAPEEHTSRANFFSSLGDAYSMRFSITGDDLDMDRAVVAQRTAIQLTPEGSVDLSRCLGNLAISLMARSQRKDDLGDINEAISAQQRAVEATSEGHTSLPAFLSGLGSAYWFRFTLTGDLSDISEAISAHRKAVKHAPEGCPDLPRWLNNLGSALMSRFQRSSNAVDIAEAISVSEKAVELAPDEHASLPTFLSSLGNAHWCQFERTKEPRDIDKSISTHQRAIETTTDGHTSLPLRLNNLGTSFLARFNLTGVPGDILQAIGAFRKAEELAPHLHSDRPTFLNNLGDAYFSRFNRSGNPSDLEDAVVAHRRAMQSTPDGHPRLPIVASAAAMSLQRRYDLAAHMSVKIEPISMQAQSEQQERSSSSTTNLRPQGKAPSKDIIVRLLNEGSLSDLDMALSLYEYAARCGFGSQMDRLRAAVVWARLVMRHDPQSPDILAAFDTVIELASLVAGLEQTIPHRHTQLQEISGLASEAAASAFRLSRADKALEWLEAGRCLVWTQLNNLRNPFDDLRTHDPKLHREIVDIAKRLEFAGTSRKELGITMSPSEKVTLEDDARDHVRLVRRWSELLNTVRAIPGFEAFLQPLTCKALLNGLPEEGSVIIVNLHESRCDAISLSAGSNEPTHIALQGFSLKKAKELRKTLGYELGGRDARGPETRAPKQRPLGTKGASVNPVHDTLGSLWVDLVKPIVEELGLTVADSTSGMTLPRLWWCPTGVLSFLPLHAAGMHSAGKSDCLLDYAIPSYTPSVNALRERRLAEPPTGVVIRGLFVTCQPEGIASSPIPGTTAEVNSICAHAEGCGVSVLKLEGDDVTPEECLKYMEEYSSIHLACHASQNAAVPLQSRFRFHRGLLDLSAIIQRNLANADFAFLSACQTSRGEEKLSDEAVHLAAGMLAAGYRRVVATMWAISDSTAQDISIGFYQSLWEGRHSEDGGTFDGSRSAYALHSATNDMRRRLGTSAESLLAWIPFVHFGY